MPWENDKKYENNSEPLNNESDYYWNEDLGYGDRYFRNPNENAFEEYDPYADSRYRIDKHHRPIYKEKPEKKINTKRAKKSHNVLYGIAILICSVLIIAMTIFMAPQIFGILWGEMDNYAFVNGLVIKYNKENVNELNRYKSYMDRDSIFPGVYINGVHVGDMAPETAKELLLNSNEGNRKNFSVTVSIGDKDWVIDDKNVDVKRNFGNVIEKAYSVGRKNSSLISSTSITPIQERFNEVVELRQKGVGLYTEWTYDKEAVKALVYNIVNYIDRAPINSQIESFDYNNREFKFTEDQAGVSIDGEELYKKVTEEIDKWSNGTVVTVEPKIVVADVTKVDMINNFKMIAAYTTKTTKSKDRNNNIDLACRSINGTALMPGEIFSFNKTVGERTVDKGYRESGAIYKGQSIQDVGGGVCQVSTTLFNAVVRADLEIVKRNNHAWPISYISIGEDASVNWPNLDFQFKNNKNTPIFVIMYYADQKTSAEIYGMTFGDGVSIDLESKVLKTSEPSPEPLYQLNSQLPIGTQKETVQARTGYMVETYKVWQKNGEEFKREAIYKTTYKPYQKTIEYNDGSQNP